MLAHIRNGEIIQEYPNDNGWVTLENGDKMSPPIEGYINGNDKIVPVTVALIDLSITTNKKYTTTVTVNADSVSKVTKAVDMTQAEIDAETNQKIINAMSDIQSAESALKALAEGLFIAYNEARTAGGKATIDKTTYYNWLKTQIGG